jgi:NF-kappa-B inhibitor alpha
MDRRRTNLPSRVETDSESEPRVPPPHLHKYGDHALEDTVDGCEAMIDSISDSGVGMSFKSTDSFGLDDDIKRLSLGSRIESLSEEQTRQPPYTSLDFHSKTDSVNLVSVDEGFSSGNLPSGLSSVGEEVLPSQCTETHSSLKNVQIMEDAQLKRQREIAAIFTQDEDGDTQLHIAIIQGMKFELMAKQMINMVPESDFLNISNNLLQTPLHVAVLTKQPSLVRHLVAMGAALDARDRNGNTPLHLACREGLLECVKSLTTPFSLEERSSMSAWALMQNIPQDGNIKNYDGETCLHMAELHHHMPVLGHLVSQVRFDVNMKDGRSGRTVLHYAIDMGLVDMVLDLLRYNCDVNARTFDGTTPLQLAYGRGQDQAVQLLLSSGADYEQITYDDSYSDMESDDEMMDGQVNEAPFYDDLAIGGQPIASV